AEAVGKLPVEQREVFLLLQQELAFKEIAEIQGCSINTVLGRMQYAMKSLRRLILEIDRGGIVT
ncbi:MAG: RNA polymerase subunit sigma-24, partial [Lentisphaeria bacterium]|nr:RNA polymerase subunit sigma-24 [Lentisphaeria bacterium]